MTDHRAPHAPGTTPQSNSRNHPRPPRRLGADLLLAATVALAIIALLAGPRFVQGAPAAAGTARGADTLLYRDSLREPVVVRSRGGVLDATLTARMDTLDVPRYKFDTIRVNGTITRIDTSIVQVPLPLRSWQINAAGVRDTTAFPGPTFRVRRGDLVRIALRNRLPDPGPTGSNDVCNQASFTGGIPDVYQDCFHGPNHTNIHYHGMHVTPTSKGDDVLLVIPPVTGFHQYSFRIPQNQSPGTHWYHPHKHGSVAIQVANGMAGAFIVEDPATGLDSIVARHKMREHLIAIQQIDTTVALLGGASLEHTPPLVNGQYQPVIYMAPGEVQRWRIVNENVTRTSKHFDVGFIDAVNAEEPRLYDIARDGVQFAPENYHPDRPDPFLHMAPGQRLDVFVKAPPVGVHQFRVSHVPGQGRQSRQPTLPPDRTVGSRRADGGGRAQEAPPVVLFTVVVDPSRTGRNTYLPQRLPELPRFLRGDLAAARDTAVVVFTDTLAQKPTQFYLGSQLSPFQRFNDENVFVPSTAKGKALPMVLGETQTWKIVNNSPQQINHPFHIHINPFQVDSVHVPRDTADPFYDLYKQLNTAARNKTPIWLDVLPLPQPTVDAAGNITDTAYVFITQKYDHFEGCRNGGDCGPPTGYFVMHCHILGHEERGMMQLLQVTRDGKVSPPSSQGRPGHGAHHGQHHAAPGGGGGQKEQPQRPPVRKDPQQHHH